MPHTSDHATRFSELDNLLTRHAGLWQIRTFHNTRLCWHDSHPALCSALLALDKSTLDKLSSDDKAIAQWLYPWLGNDAVRLVELSQLPRLTQRPISLPSRFDTGIAGRKLQQIQSFAALLPTENRPLLEWCAGKGHLGRLLALVDSRQVTSLELSTSLCKEGQIEATRNNISQQFICADALDPNSGNWLPDHGQVVALHACGELHTTLMRHWVGSNCARITISPCCYHLIHTDNYQPLSACARASTLQLSKLDLQLPLQETVTGGRSIQRKRETEVLWRLAFDEWQREVRGIDEYLPLPSPAKSLFSGAFHTFHQWAAQSKGLKPPASLNENHWLQRAAVRAELVRLMELVSHFFRRPLELWLALDRVLFLQERGAQVRLGAFCDKPVTPRNILIDAQR